MKQELFRNVYQHIHLSAQQKDRIWKQIQTTCNPEPVRKKVFLPTRAAVCLGVVLMSGMTVLAANELSLMDRLSEAIAVLTQNGNDMTEDQKNLYAQYGQVLDSEIELEYGTLRLDAALYDENHLLIPFRYIFRTDVADYEELTAGTDFEQNSLPKPFNAYHRDTAAFLREYLFYTVQDSTQLNKKPNCSLLITNPKIAEDGILSGGLLLYDDENQTFAQGNVIQLVKKTDADTPSQTAETTDDSGRSEPYASFTLEKALTQHELTIDAENAAALKDMGISVDRMSVSPLSLCYSGKGTHTKALSASITVVRKDGRVIEKSPNGSGYALSDANRDNTSFSFFARVLFAEPVLPEDIAEIHIQDNQGTDILIPMGIN